MLNTWFSSSSIKNARKWLRISVNGDPPENGCFLEIVILFYDMAQTRGIEQVLAVVIVSFDG